MNPLVKKDVQRLHCKVFINLLQISLLDQMSWHCLKDIIPRSSWAQAKKKKKKCVCVGYEGGVFLTQVKFTSIDTCIETCHSLWKIPLYPCS